MLIGNLGNITKELVVVNKLFIRNKDIFKVANHSAVLVERFNYGDLVVRSLAGVWLIQRVSGQIGYGVQFQEASNCFMYCGDWYSKELVEKCLLLEELQYGEFVAWAFNQFKLDRIKRNRFREKLEHVLIKVLLIVSKKRLSSKIVFTY